ncbi:hypothetical protein CAOG_04268 [Capsaspora owczarzaki ATCC 30864]|uniref:Proteasome assembly chaperone 2 n=1 Tax=Capsaspora owczarzaki (strain ATCC 30864) TaxID=595528 RepID=A0A0D2UEC9_CAPO3|nr:hypothetical protein CAOG_04268 [Capsaspora owczarzaki ATCC 30864]KJE93481.1 hypothetical protein CAOG_004268 [Capsaspora owczarzaki ATCC 30864]|eukprot:XP_004348093.1 hypothetical protein CAOG_04268 [Capsaspora owczarzaki ATCC 30864]
MAAQLFYPDLATVGTSHVDLTNYTLILPCESVGNVGQLCIDLLGATLLHQAATASSKHTSFQRIGFLHSSALLPAAGNDALAPASVASQGNLCTAAEVFRDTSRKIVLIQQRAPIVKSRRREFATALTQWFTQHEFAKILVLASIDANIRRDSQLVGLPFRYLTSPSMMHLETKLGSLGVRTVEPAADLQFLGDRVTEKTKQRAMFAGSGIARILFEQGVMMDLPIAVLFKFCAEGDNRADAARLASLVSQLVTVVDAPPPPSAIADSEELPAVWQSPASWHAVFGAPAAASLF